MSWFANKSRLIGLSCLTVGQLLNTLPAVADRPSVQSTPANLSSVVINQGLGKYSQKRSPEEILKLQRINVEKYMSIDRPNGFNASDSVNAVSGGSCGGGGTTVEFEGHAILLDLLHINIPQYLNFKDPDIIHLDNSGPEILHKANFTGAFLAQGELQKITVEKSLYDEKINQIKNLTEINAPGDFIFSDPMKLAIKVLTVWTNNNIMDLGSELSIHGMLYPVTWEFAVGKLQGSTASLNNFDNVKLLSPRLAAYYHHNFSSKNHSESNYTIQISLSEWNKLSILSQAGLMIHEGFRHSEFLNRYNSQSELIFDDLDLQIATAITLLCKPRPILSQYINFLLLGLRTETTTEQQYGTYSSVIKKYCIPSFNQELGTLNFNE